MILSKQHGEDYSFHMETIMDVKDEVEPLLELHWEEIALNKDSIPLNPAWDRYLELEKVGVAGTYTCRYQGELVGYLVVFADKHLHYQDHIFANNDVLYLKPEHRTIGVGAAFISFVVDHLKELGASVFHINTKAHQSFAPLLENLGFEEVETTYGYKLN